MTRIDRFLRGTRWENANRLPLAGDASGRRYFRLKTDAETAVLMDATDEDPKAVQSFVEIGGWLSETGLSAPATLLADMDQRLLLLEDLGDDLFAKLVHNEPTQERRLYIAAANVLLAVHQAPAPQGMVIYDPTLMAKQSSDAVGWYLRGTGQQSGDFAKSFQASFEHLLNEHCGKCDVVMLRDFHAENLIWLPDRQGNARVGLLDYQDAMIGHRAYDLVSLLQDARRDVSSQAQAAALDHFIETTGADRERFLSSYAVLGIQRNLRILGIFTRLCLHFGKVNYIDYLPRVWGYLTHNLDRPALTSFRQSTLENLPAPTPQILKKLKEQCAKVQMP